MSKLIAITFEEAVERYHNGKDTNILIRGDSWESSTLSTFKNLLDDDRIIYLIDDDCEESETGEVADPDDNCEEEPKADTVLSGFVAVPPPMTESDEEKEEPDPEEKKTPEKAPSVSKEKRKLDDGKIVALRKAGWSLAKIGDEMGVSAQTISNHLKQAGLT